MLKCKCTGSGGALVKDFAGEVESENRLEEELARYKGAAGINPGVRKCLLEASTISVWPGHRV